MNLRQYLARILSDERAVFVSLADLPAEDKQTVLIARAKEDYKEGWMDECELEQRVADILNGDADTPESRYAILEYGDLNA